MALILGAWATWVYAIPHYTRVPALGTVTVDRAVQLLDAAGLRTRLGPTEFSGTVQSGMVIRTVPPQGSRVRTGGQILLITSKGPELIMVPDVHNLKQADAEKALTDAGFAVNVTFQYNDQVKGGRVIDQNPEQDQRFVKGSNVTIIVSQGPQPVAVPDVHGQPAADAQTTLEGLGFVVQQRQEFSAGVAAGFVIGTNPPAGFRAPKGSTVTVFVSKGPKTFPMPNVVGMTKEAALAELQAMGLVVDVVVIPQSSGDMVVLQAPSAGTTVRHGDHVRIYVTGP
jgi:serine/threonine-protein kinase